MDLEKQNRQKVSVRTENSVQPMADVIPSNRTANLEQFAALLESGEQISLMHACAREHSSDRDFKAVPTENPVWPITARRAHVTHVTQPLCILLISNVLLVLARHRVVAPPARCDLLFLTAYLWLANW